jgi:hypothetical protein
VVIYLTDGVRAVIVVAASLTCLMYTQLQLTVPRLSQGKTGMSGGGGWEDITVLLERISDIDRNLDEDATLFDEEGNLDLDFTL